MALLTRDLQDRVVSLLVDEGLVDGDIVKVIRGDPEKSKQPILSVLSTEKHVTGEAITHATAVVMGVPYVNLKNVTIEQETLLNLTQDVAERSMAVALGEKDGRLTIAMLDVTNVQATDYLATLTKKPIRSVMASEDGIRAVLMQYRSDFSSIKRAVKQTNEEAAVLPRSMIFARTVPATRQTASTGSSPPKPAI